MTHTSARMAQFRPSPTIAMSALVRRLKAEGRSIIGLVGGEPDFATPDNIKDAGIRAIVGNNTRYTDVDGTIALRQALSAKFKRENGLDYKPDQIVVSSGTKPLLHAALLAMTDPGDEVIIPAPHWVSHPDITRIVGAVPVAVPCPPETGFRLSPEALEAAITPRTRVLILNSPNNPTGTAYQEDELRALIAVLQRHPDIWVLTDEIYEHIRFDGCVAPSIAALDAGIAERVVTANGFSKGYVMTGWRIGFAGGPAEMMKAIKLIVGQLVGSPNAIAQAAAVEALTGDQSFIEENAAIFQERGTSLCRRCSSRRACAATRRRARSTCSPTARGRSAARCRMAGSSRPTRISCSAPSSTPASPWCPAARSACPPYFRLSLLAGHRPIAHRHGPPAPLLQRTYLTGSEGLRPSAGLGRAQPYLAKGEHKWISPPASYPACASWSWARSSPAPSPVPSSPTSAPRC